MVDFDSPRPLECKHLARRGTGWEDWRQVHGSVIQIDLRGEKVWIQHDGTEVGVAHELEATGTPREQIVLGFHHPSKRKHTPYQVA